MAQFNHHRVYAWLFIAPQIFITLVFFVWPAFNALVHSFFFTDAFGMQQHFAGFTNFFDLFRDNSYIKAIWVTLIIAISVTFLTMSFGLIMANLVNNRTRSQEIYKTLLIWPYAIAPAIAAILWRFLCHPTLGWMTYCLNHLGIHFDYINNKNQALLVIIITASWQQFSYNFLFYCAALKAVPQTLIDAAIIDGASPRQRFWQIIIPIVSPTTFFLILMNLVYGFFDTFGIIQVLTHGGPGNSTKNLIYKVYEDGFEGMDLGSSSAQSVLLMIIVVLISLVQFKFLEKKVHYMNRIVSHGILILFILFMFLPIYLALVAASGDGSAIMQSRMPLVPSSSFFSNMHTVLSKGLAVTGGEPIISMLWNSLVMALVIALGKIVLALGSAFALVYFDFPFKKWCFALIFATLMLPVEVRIVPTFQVVASFGLLNSFSGLTLPLLASATGTFLFRQFFKTIPKELVDAAKLDGAGPIRFFWDMVIPLSRTQISALFVILFVYGWNQYLWPLVITTDPQMATIVMGIHYLAGVADQVPEWHYIMTVALIALLPPCLVVILTQRWFEKGLN